MNKWFGIVAFAGGAIGMAGISPAAPVELKSTTGESSGWTWEVSATDAPFVNLVFIRTEGNNFYFQKDATLTRSTDPLVIRFNRIDPAAKTLVINDENVTNQTGVDWGGFRMELSSGSVGSTPNFVLMTDDGTPGIGDFNIDPFTSFTFYNNASGLLLNGGIVANNTTWFPGQNSDTGLALVATNQSAGTFSLKEIPIPIPLPAAAWTGASMLLGLAGIGSLKRIRRIS